MYKTTNIKNILMLIVSIMVGYSNNLIAQSDPILIEADSTLMSKYYLEPLGKTEGYEYSVTYVNPPDTPPDQHPQGQYWLSQKVVKTTITVEGCEVMVWVDWLCRRSYKGDPEIFISRVTYETKTEECKKKLKYYKSQIIDYLGYVLMLKAECFPEFNSEYDIPICNGDKKFSTVYRLYVNTCGSWYYHKNNLHHEFFVPCETKSYCRLAYSYCRTYVDGKLVIVKKIQRVNETPSDNDSELTDEQIKEREYYYCPLYEVYEDKDTKEKKKRDCLDENCRLRKDGLYEATILPIFDERDIDGNPPHKLETVPCLE